MQALLRDALDEGAYGFTSSQLELHVAHDGRGVPSNHAAPDRARARWHRCCGEYGRGAIEFIPRTFLTGYDDDDRRLISISPRASGRPVHLNTLTQMPARARRMVAQPRVRARTAAERARDPSDVRLQPAGRALLARHDVPLRRDAELPRHAHTPRTRTSQRLRDPALPHEHEAATARDRRSRLASGRASAGSRSRCERSGSGSVSVSRKLGISSNRNVVSSEKCAPCRLDANIGWTSRPSRSAASCANSRLRDQPSGACGIWVSVLRCTGRPEARAMVEHQLAVVVVVAVEERARDELDRAPAELVQHRRPARRARRAPRGWTARRARRARRAARAATT